jgi:MFS family permease
VLAIGCLLFGLASAGCALATSAAGLIVGRLTQGIAAALVAPASLALIGATYPRDERNAAVATWAAASALTTAAGPVLGGFLTDTFGWQSVFWINPPLGVLAAGMLAAFAPQDRREPRAFDVIGATILASALGSLAWALSQIGPRETAAENVTVSASANTVIAAGLGVGGLVAYAFWERASNHPMTPPRLLENRAFVGLNLATLMSYVGLSIMFFLTPFDLMDRRGLTSTGAALAFLPFTLGLALLSRPFGSLADAVGARPMLIAGPISAAIAYIWMAIGHDATLVVGVWPHGFARHLVRGASSAAHRVHSFNRQARRRRACVGYQQCDQPHCATHRHRACGGRCVVRLRL